jgi:hypothetical protein
MYSSAHHEFWYWMEMNGWFHTLAALLLENWPPVVTGQEDGWATHLV